MCVRSELSAVQHGNANESPVLSGQTTPGELEGLTDFESAINRAAQVSDETSGTHGFSDPIATMGRQLIRLLPQVQSPT